MARHLYAIHDWDPTWAQMVQAAGVTGWCVTTHALAEEGPYDFRPMANYGITPIARLNYGYSPTGTLPLPAYYADFARLCALFVQKSPGCSRWIIANEINMKIEHPQGVPISPVDYARCFKLCRDAIKAIQPNAEVIPAAIAPWNVESGPWMDYFDVMLSVIGAGGLDGIALHTYSRGNTPDAVRSVAKMDPPFAQFYSGFRAFQDFLSHVPPAMRRLPVYITEFNGNQRWVDANTGFVQTAYQEINAWNRMGATQKIQALTLFRWPAFDTEWSFQDKRGVHADFVAAMAHGYESPKVQTGGGDIFLPVTPKPEGGTPVTVNREWDSRLDGRGVKVVDAPSGTAWRVARGQWFDEAQAGGRHHIYVEALDELGNPLGGVPFVVSWPGGQATQHSKTGRGFDAGNFPMSKSLNEFSVRIDDILPSDTVSGIGMGANGNAGIHTSTLLTFQRTQTGTVTLPPTTGEGPSQPTPAPQPTMPPLVHPVEDARHRTVTQPFGVNRDFYKQYSVDGVPLLGHNGVDFGTPVGSVIVAVADGQAVEVANDPSGYGLYVKLEHGWGQSLYAHLLEQEVTQGSHVRRGEVVGLSGNSGNSTGPHLHFGLRVAPFSRRDGWGGYTDPMRYLAGHPQTGGGGPIWAILQAAALEFAVDRHLLASLAWAESSWRPDAVSDAGARGLMQIMPATWDEWAKQTGATNPFDARDSARTGAAYLAWLLRVAGGERRALWAWNWGIGNVLSDKTPPPETLEFANKALHGRDLLRAILG